MPPLLYRDATRFGDLEFQGDVYADEMGLLSPCGLDEPEGCSLCCPQVPRRPASCGSRWVAGQITLYRGPDFDTVSEAEER